MERQNSEAEINCSVEQISESQNETTKPELECKQEISSKTNKCVNMSPGAVKLREWLNKPLKIEMSDGRILIGVFLCTDRDCNVILGSCSEYLPEEDTNNVALSQDEPRMLGLVMVPGKHIINVCIDQNENYIPHISTPLTPDIPVEEVT